MRKTHFKKRQSRTRFRLGTHGTRPRLSVFRSGKHIYAQVIDDTQALTVAVRAIAAGEPVDGLDPPATAAYRFALDALADLGTPTEQIAGLAVFRTQDPTAELRRAVTLYASDRSASPQPTPTTRN